MQAKLGYLAASACLLLACSDDDAASADQPAAQSASAGSPAPVAAKSGIVPAQDGESLIFLTEPVELEPGQERYTCFAADLDEDVVIDGFSKGRQAFVHHVQFARTLAPEPKGVSECDVLFKLTWSPLFLTGAGATELRLDEGVGHKLPKGTQLIAQLHVLNTSERPVREPVEIMMHRSRSADPTPVSPYVVGSTAIMLPPGERSEVKNVCTIDKHTELVAVFPHMHLMGKKLSVEIGKAEDAMRPLYGRDPYDFDDQHMEKLNISLEPGDKVRITCNYDNDTDKVATFGESTHDEMCFLVGFALGDQVAQPNCPNLWQNVDFSKFK